MKEREVDFHLLEFETLRRKIDECVSEFRALERYAILASAAVYSFGFSQGSEDHRDITFVVPLLIAFLGALRAFAMRAYITRIGRYLLTLEERLSGSMQMGFERYLVINGRGLETVASFSVWISLVLFNVVVWWVMSLGE